jgi:hypothetical protein
MSVSLPMVYLYNLVHRGLAMDTLYDIFSGTQSDAIWLEAVTGLKEAVSRMEQQARQKPGPYFVFDTRTQRVIASLNSDWDAPNAQLLDV